MKKLYNTPGIELVRFDLSFAVLADTLVVTSRETPVARGTGMDERAERSINLDDFYF